MPEEPSELHPEAARMIKLAKHQKYDELEEAWMAAVESGAISLGDLAAVAKEFHRRDERQAESLLWLLLTLRAEKMGPAAALEAAVAVADYLPDGKTLRDEVAGAYRQARADNPHINRLAEITVLRQDAPLKLAILALEHMLALPPGSYVLDVKSDKVGRVIGPSAADPGLAVAFVAKSGPKEQVYDFAAVTRIEALSPDDFRALALFERERLQALAESDPVEVARLALRGYGSRLEYKELKARVGAVLPDGAWSRWWSNCRLLLKRSPLFEMTDSAQPLLVLRNRPLAAEERVRSRFAAAAPRERLAIALDYLAESDAGAQADDPLLEHLAAGLRPLAAELAAEPALALGALALVNDIHRRVPAAAPPAAEDFDNILGGVEDLSLLFNSELDERLAQRILRAARAAMPAAWSELYAMVFPGCGQATCDWIANELMQADQALVLSGAVAAVLQRPYRYVSALIWIWKAAAADRHPAALGNLDRMALTIHLYAAAESVARSNMPPAAQKQLLADLRAALAAKNAQALRGIFAKTDRQDAVHARHLIERNPGLTEHARYQAMRILQDRHPELFAETVAPWEEDAIYTTAEGLEKRRVEFDALCHERIPANAKAIGEAAQRGDLSENAEFTAALEERDRLTERAAAMEAELKKARVISRGGAAGHAEAAIGSAVKVRNLDSGAETTFTFLGPWDVDRERNIYSYRAPLGLALMGKKVGEKVSLQIDGVETRYEIREIAPGRY